MALGLMKDTFLEAPELLRRQFARAYAATRAMIAATDHGPEQNFIWIMVGQGNAFDELVRHLDGTLPTSSGRIPCKAGCATCCYLRVDVSASEAVLIALYARQHRVSTNRVAMVARAVDGLEAGARWARGIACPFLAQRRCSIYPARPRACRGYISSSLPACLTAFRRRKDPNRPKVPLVAEPQQFSSMVRLGADCAFRAHGFQMAIGELAAMVEQALRPGAVERWFAGEAVFESDEAQDYCAMLDELYESAKDADDFKAEMAAVAAES
jgi:Fe-S-cluster containining protein